MSTVELKVDGQKISARQGMTVLEAALAAGVYIPNLCADPDLRAFGACRLCVVEIDGIRGLPASCTVPVSEGMVVRTETPLVQMTRRAIVELLLADHPENCINCAKNNRCALQTVAAFVGVRENRYPKTTRKLPVDDSSPFFTYDPNKCVLCSKCVRVCDEIQGLGNLTWVNRGYATRVGTFLERPIAQSMCESCGQCEAKCPVGAITAKGYQQPNRKVKTICPYCGVGCTLELHVQDNRIVKVTSPFDADVTRGNLCIKGRFATTYVETTAAPTPAAGGGER